VGDPIYGPRSSVTLEAVVGSECCAPECFAPSFEDAPFPICADHYIVIVRHFEAYKAAVAPAEETPTAWPDHGRDEVYFVRLGARVKIGYSRNVSRRLTEIPHDEVLAVMAGDRSVERGWHARFAAQRIQGEWFAATPILLATVASI
jgi:hypothetical protein